MRAGYMKKCGRPAIEQVLHGNVVANCKPGVIGVEVNIVPQNIHFPDEVSIIKPEEFKVVEEVVEIASETGEAKVAVEGEKPKEKKEAKAEAKKDVKTEKPKAEKKEKADKKEAKPGVEKLKAEKKEKPEKKEEAKAAEKKE
jgi:small subunit ribosomal protein S3